MMASCSGVEFMNPWPMPRLKVSPCCQGLPSFSCFHARLGWMPADSPGRPSSLMRPKPRRAPTSAIRSMPALRAAS